MAASPPELPPGTCRKQREQNRADGHRKRSFARLDHSGDVSLRDVADFVTDDARKFAFGLRGDDQTRMHGNKPARQCEGV